MGHRADAGVLTETPRTRSLPSVYAREEIGKDEFEARCQGPDGRAA
jgi:hypothetical protein